MVRGLGYIRRVRFGIPQVNASKGVSRSAGD